jgi:hypothetical protein
MSQDEFENKTIKKFQREMSKAGQNAEKIESHDVNAFFSSNSETEREKSSKRRPTGTQDREPKNYRKKKDVPSSRPFK